jgi:Tetrapyrrole (Corrin/Porphyrin) Methylases
VAHMSPQALSYIEQADIVFYHATNGVTATQILQRSREAVDLYQYYGEGKQRKITYVQMAELMLREVRRGRSVVGAFHGHPGFFVSPARRALAIAAAEGYETALIPAISAPDCLFADLRVDPGVFGCQIIMASRILSEKCIIATSGHVVLLQVNAVGDKGFSFTGYKNNSLGRLFERLEDIYGPDHDCVYYMAAIFPGLKPEVAAHKLKDYRNRQLQNSVRAGMLYLPPKGVSFASLIDDQAFTKGVVYGSVEEEAIADLDHHETPIGFPSRRASDALLGVMSELAQDARSLDRYVHSPNDFVDQCISLSSDEREALRQRRVSALRRVTTVRPASPGQ